MNYRCIKETLSLRHEDRDRLPAILDRINAMLAEHAGLAREEPPGASLDKIASGSLDIALAAYTPVCSLGEYTGIKLDILLRSLKIVEEEGAALFIPLNLPHS
jgi:MscS family membrane protein